jgi:hypothetical protein
LKTSEKHKDGESVLHPEQVRIWRGMRPEDKLRIAENIYWSAREAKEAWLRQLHPLYTEEQIEEQVRDIFLHATT